MTAQPCPQPFNLAAHVLRLAGDLQDKTALQILHPEGPESWSYGRLQAAVLGAGAGFLAQGLRPGDRVLLRLGATPAFPVAFLGAIAAGLVAVATSPLLTAAELGHAVVTTTPRLILADDAVYSGAIPVLTSSQVLAMSALAPCAFDLGDANRPAYVIFTSGTSTGRPLAVVHAHRAIWARRMMHQDWQGLGPTDRVLHAGAFNWTYTLGVGLMDPWTCGATALIPAPGTGTADLPKLMVTARATIFAGVPGIYRRLLRAGLPALPDLRHGLSAGETLPPDLRQDWQRATGTDVHEALGMTEVSTYLSGSPKHPAPPGSVGFAQPGRRILLLDDAGQPAKPGQPGQIALAADDPGLMLGYLNDDAQTRARYSAGMFLTGDWALQRPDGAFVTLGRQDDLINAGGIRVSPLEVEAALASFPGVTDCATTEIEVTPGTRIIAGFYASPGPLDEAAISAHCAAVLAPYKVPRLFCRLDLLPRNANGKLRRGDLAALYAKGCAT